MKKQPEVTDATRNTFIRVFCELYRSKPIEKITIREITEISGYNRSTFYQYFKDVYDLLDYIENELIAVIANSIASTQVTDLHFTENFVVMLSYILREHDYYSTILTCSGANSGFVRKIRGCMLPIFVDKFQITENNMSSIYVLEFYLSGILTTLTHWLEEPESLTLSQLGTLIQGIWGEGLLSQLK